MNENQEKYGQKSIQDSIEALVKEIVKKGHYEAAFLFNDEGLLIAKYSRRELLAEHHIVEISVMMQKVKQFVKNMSGLSEIKEIYIEDTLAKKWVFRFISFFGQNAIFVALIPPRKSYRGATNKLLQRIAKLDNSPI